MVGFNALDAVDLQRVAGARQVRKAVVQCPAHQRLEGVELQLARFGRHGDGHVVANDFKAHLVHHLRNYRVDLARHDRRACLARRQPDVAHTGLRAGRQQAQVVADLRQLAGNALQNARNVHKSAGIGGGGNHVGSGSDRHARQLGQGGDDQFGVAHRRIDAGADGGAAQVHFGHQVGRCAQALFVVGHHAGKGIEFLAQRHRHGVL